jgi:hypothetical protein
LRTSDPVLLHCWFLSGRFSTQVSMDGELGREMYACLGVALPISGVGD